MPGSLSEFVITLSSAADRESAVREGVAHAARVFDADLAAWVRGNQIVTRAGVGIDRLSDAQILTAATTRASGLQPAGLAVSSLDAGDLAALVLARGGSKGLAPAEQGLLDDMARALALAWGSRDFPSERGGSTGERHVDLHGADRALRNSEHRLRKILQSASDAFIALDSEGLILDWNGEAEVTFGWPRTQALGCKLGDTILAPGSREAFDAEIDSMSRDDEPGEQHRIELGALHRDGHEVPIELKMSRLKAGSTHILQVFVRDRTESVEAERERRRAEDQLALQALRDPLTGLPNRALLFDRLAHALAVAKRRGSSLAVLFVDLDNFRLVNENLGHQVGDELLIELAGRLARTVRLSDTTVRMGEDTVVRFGGDEFVIVCEEVANERDAITIAQRVTTTLSEPFAFAGEQLTTTACIGIGFGGGEATPDSVIREAEAAMYRAKEQGRARYELFDPTMGARAFTRLHDEAELRQAIDCQQLRVFYQPIVSVLDGALRGVEALVRWEHPERGLLLPAEFLPLAEETGMIVPLGRWVLGEACEQARRWQLDQLDGSLLRVAVNVSVQQLAGGELVRLVADQLARTGLEPASLALEITESVLMEESNDPVAVLGELRELGVQISLDDFGTGYSSLSYLQRLPLDTVKLDRSFISGLSEREADRQIVGAIVQMMRALSMTVIGEGVETSEQWTGLRELGCHLAQGYYFARPMPAAEMTSMLAQARDPRREPLSGAASLQRRAV